MKLFYIFLFFVLFSTVSHSQDKGRTYLDYMSVVAPADWEMAIFSDSISFTAPDRLDTSHVRCSIIINAAGVSTGGPLELLSSADQRTPGNLQRERALPARELKNGWQTTERAYRNRYIPNIFQRAIVITRNGTGQVLRASNELSSCGASSDAVIRTLRIGDAPRRMNSSGAPLKLLPPRAPERSGSTRQRTGTVCVAGGITCLNSDFVGSSCMCASTNGLQIGTVQ